jgi:protein translocase, SecG subunit
MSVIHYIAGAVLLIFSILIIIIVLAQEGRQAGLSGVISGGADSFLSKNKARNIDTFLAKWTKIFAIVFFVLILGVNAIILFVK